ncbi:glutamine--tRNA ligase, partial [Deinococcus sp. 23YEL01]|nr:glutamine--tRNA ligase [Deinococcus sp. 23YEL01]
RVAREVLARAAQTGEAPAEIIERENLAGGLSEGALSAAVAQVMAANPDKVEAYRGGRTALLGFFTGQVMRATGGKADPATLNAALEAALAG